MRDVHSPAGSPGALVPYLACIAAFVVLVGTDPGALTSAYLGRESDGAKTQLWAQWWLLERALAGGPPALGFPWGVDVVGFLSGNLAAPLLALPFRLVLPQPLAQNVFLLACLAANVFAYRRLGLAAGASSAAAWMVAIPVAFNPTAVGAFVDGHPEAGLRVFLVLALAQFLRAAPGWRPALAGGGWFLLAGLVSWRGAVFALLACALVTLVAGKEHRTARLRVLALGAPVFLLAPGLFTGGELPLALDPTSWSPWAWPGDAGASASGLTSLQVGSRTSGEWLVGKLGDLGFSGRRKEILLAELVLLAAGFVFASADRVRTALVLVGVGVVVASGPVFLGLPNPAWIGAARQFPLLREPLAPIDAMACFHAGVAILACAAWDALARAWRTRLALVAGAWALWAGELSSGRVVPLDAWMPEPPEFYTCLAEATDGAVIPLPADDTPTQALYQTVHGRPVLAGLDGSELSSLPAEGRAVVDSNLLLVAMAAVVDGKLEVPPVDEVDVQVLGRLGFAYVVLDKRAMLVGGEASERKALKRIEAVQRRLSELLGEPVYADIDTVAWAPWGASSPCGRSTSIEPDTTPMMDDPPEEEQETTGRSQRPRL